MKTRYYYTILVRLSFAFSFLLYAGLLALPLLAQSSVSIPLTLKDDSGVNRTNDSVTTGVPLRQVDNITGDPHAALMVTDSSGATVPSQMTVLARWGGAPTDNAKAVKWVLLDFQASVPANGSSVYYLKTRTGNDPGFSGLTLTQDSTLITVNTGPLQFTVRKDTFNFFNTVTLNGVSLVNSSSGNNFKVVADGTPYSSANPGGNYQAIVEYAGPQRAQIRLRGAFVDSGGKKKCLFDVRMIAYAGQSAVKVLATWTLDQDAYVFKPSQISLMLPLQLGNTLTFTSGSAGVAMTGSDDSYLAQDDYNHFSVAKNGGTVGSGTQSAGWADVSNGSSGLTVYIRDMWQNFPLELEANGSSLNAHLWPIHADLVTQVANKQAVALHPPPSVQANQYFPYQKTNNLDLTASYALGETIYNQGPFNAVGTAKTWELMYYFHGPSADSAGTSARFQNFLIGMNAQWFADSGAIGPALAYDPADFPVEEGIQDSIYNYVKAWRDNNYLYGSFVYGDQNDSPSSAADRFWAQGRYGWQSAMLAQFLRTGELKSDSRKYFDYSYPTITHNMDVDRQHVTTAFVDANGSHVDKVDGGCNSTISLGTAHWGTWSAGVPETSNGEPEMDCQIGAMKILYFLTGYQRSYDVSLARIATLRSLTPYQDATCGATTPCGPENRAAGGGMSVYTDEIDLTGSSTDADTLWNHVARYTITPIGTTAVDYQSVNWTAFGMNWQLWPYYQYAAVKNDATVTANVSRTLRACAGMGQIASPLSSGARGCPDYAGLAAAPLCYSLTGDTACRNYAQRYLQLFENPLYLTSSGFLLGYGSTFWILERMPWMLKALHGFTSYTEPPYAISYFQLPASQTVTLKARKPADQSWNFTMVYDCGVGVDDGYPYPCTPITVKVVDPAGRTVSGYPQSYTPPNLLTDMIASGGDLRYHKYTVPADGLTGDYQIQIVQSRTADQVIAGLAGSSLAKVWAALPAGGMNLDTGMYYFNVPSGTSSFSVTCQQGCKIVAPDNTSTTGCCGLANSFKPTSAQIGLWRVQYYFDYAPYPSGLQLSGVPGDVSFSAATNPNSLTIVTSGNPCDVNGDGALNVLDVQLAIDQAVGVLPCGAGDINKDGKCDQSDYAIAINASLSGVCNISRTTLPLSFLIQPATLSTRKAAPLRSEKPPR